MIAGYKGKRRWRDNPVPPYADLVHFGHHEVNAQTNTYQDAENNDPHTRL
jgi:hypothetical protein